MSAIAVAPTPPARRPMSLAVASVGSPVAMSNSAYYLGSGPAFYAGPMNDIAVAVADINAAADYLPTRQTVSRAAGASLLVWRRPHMAV